jgi:hypothetical protein
VALHHAGVTASHEGSAVTSHEGGASHWHDADAAQIDLLAFELAGGISICLGLFHLKFLDVLRTTWSSSRFVCFWVTPSPAFLSLFLRADF